MEMIHIEGTDLKLSRIALGTWAIGGWMWGGTDENTSIKTIHAALDKGVNLIDTAPVYGFGRSEEIVGRALKAYGKRDQVHISTKAGLQWKDNRISRNSSPKRLSEEVDASLKRLGTDVIDIYYIHWPDPKVPFEKTAEYLMRLKEAGKIRAIGVSNYTPEQMEAFRNAADLNFLQPPYNIFEREIEKEIVPYCSKKNISLMTYGALCRGLLSGRMSLDREFNGDDLRKHDPKFQSARFEQYLKAAERISHEARERFDKALLPTAVRWVLDMGAEIAIWGGRRPDQMDPLEEIDGWHIDEAFKKSVETILAETVKDPVGPGFMAPPED